MISKQTMSSVWDYVQEHGEEQASENFNISLKSVRRYVQLYKKYFLNDETPEVIKGNNGKVTVSGSNITNELDARKFAGVSRDQYDTHRIDVNFRPDGTSQYKISFVPKKGVSAVDPEAYARAFAEHIATYKTPTFPSYIHRDSNNLLTISISDWHHGKQVWGEEISGGGENWDIHESRDMFEKYIAYAMYKVRNTTIDTVLIEAHGDVLNVDNVNNTTLSGTQQAEDSRFIKTQWYMENMLVDAIATLRTIANNVILLIVPGNHDATRILMLGRYVEAFFRNDHGVSVMCDPAPRKRVVWGRTLLGYSHEEKGNVVQSMFTLWPVDCARCQDLIMNTGHLHTRKEMETILYYEQKVLIRQHPAMVPRDAWSDSQGYSHVREGLIRVFDKGLGQTDEFIFKPHFMW